MRRPSAHVKFLLYFALVFALLAAPWPGWKKTYAQGLRGFGQALFGSLGSKAVVRFRANPEPHPELDSVIYIGNKDQLDSAGRGKAANLTFNSRYIGFFPTALTVALILATPIPWRRRGWALLWGLLGIHAFIAALFGIMILAVLGSNPWLELVKPGAVWARPAIWLHDLFATYLGARFAVAVLIWFAVSFRKGDWQTILGRPSTSAEESARATPARR